MRLTLNQKEAAASIGISVNTFRREVRPYVRTVSLGRTLLFPVSDLEKWVDKKARGL